MENWDKCSYDVPGNRKISGLSLISKKVCSGRWRHDTRHGEIGQLDGTVLIQGLARWVKGAVVGIQIE